MIAGSLALLGATGSVASAQVTPAGGDFQSTPTGWTTTALPGSLNTVSASQVSSGANKFYRTQYATLAGVLGGSLLNLKATEGITSPQFTWNQASPQAITASFDEGVTFSGLLGVDANAGIGMYLDNLTTGTNTLLAAQRLTQNTPDFSTVSASVSPSLLISGDNYQVQVNETFAPTVAVAGSTTIDLDNVNLTETPANPPAPALTQGSAAVTNVTSSGATVNATIDPGSAATTVDVVYATTPNGTTATTASQTIPANSGPTAVSIPLSGLNASTGYQAQIVATNAGGTTSSAQLPFTTTAASTSVAAPVIGSGGAQGAPGERAATVGTTINDGGAGSTYYVRYGTTTTYSNSTSPQTNPAGTTGSTAVTTGLSGLTPGTTYHAQYVVTNSAGTTAGTDFTFTTAAASPPTVAAASASTTSTDGTQETVSATVNPGANDTQVTVSYGPNSGYGSTTSSVLVPGGSGAQTVSIPISGLNPGSTYHYSVTASNVDGNVATPDATFTPTAQTSPPIGTTSVSAGPDEHSATLASTINSNGNGGTYYLQYGTSTGYGSQTAPQNLATTNGNQPLSASLSGLQPGTTYHAQFVAMVNGYATSDGTDFTFTTAAASPPTITSGPGAATSDSAGDQETITANVDPGTHDTQVSVAYGMSNAYGSTTAATTIPANSGATSVSIPISGLTPGQTYHYQLTATNADGAVNSVDQTFTPTTSSAPPVGTTSVSSGPGESTVTLASSVAANNPGGTYYVQYGPDAGYGTQTAPQAIPTNGQLSASLSGLQPGTTYHAQFVVMVQGSPATSYGSDVTFTTTAAPAFTSGPTASSSGTAGTAQTINAGVDPGGLSTAVTVQYGATNSYGTTSQTVTVPASNSSEPVSIPLAGLTPGNTYHYAVFASNSDSNSPTQTSDGTFQTMASNPLTVTTGPGSPSAGERSATASASVDTNGSGGTWYLQYGTTTSYGNQGPSQNLTTSSNPQNLNASITGLQPATTYHAQFVVLANGYPQSTGQDFTFTTAPKSPPAFVGQPSATTATADGTQETIATDVTPGTQDTQVTVSYGTDATYGSTSAATTVSGNSGSTPVSLLLTGLTPGVTYHYRVNATSIDGAVTTSDQTFTPMATGQPPVGPTSAPQPPSTSTATLDSSTNSGGSGGTYYIEYGTDTGYGSQTPSQSLTATTGSQPLSTRLTGLTSGTTYHARYVILVDGRPAGYGADYVFTTAGAATSSPGSTGTGTTGTTGSGTTTPAPSPSPAPAPAPTPVASGPSCLAASVSASTRTLRMVSLPARAQLTSRRGLRVSLARRVRLHGTATFQVTGGKPTRIRGRSFTVTMAMLRAGRTSTVRVRIPQRPRSATATLRVRTIGCGIRLSQASGGRSLSLTLPLGARRVALALPRGTASPSTFAVATTTGTRTYALTGRGARLHLRRAAGALRISARGRSVTVTGLASTTTGLRLRFPASKASGWVTARVNQLVGGSATARVRIGRRAR